MKILKNMIKEKINSPQNRHGWDFLDQALNDMDKDKFLTKDFIVRMLFSVLFAAFESISSALSLCLSFLVDHPSVVQELKVCQMYQHELFFWLAVLLMINIHGITVLMPLPLGWAWGTTGKERESKFLTHMGLVRVDDLYPSCLFYDFSQHVHSPDPIIQFPYIDFAVCKFIAGDQWSSQIGKCCSWFTAKSIERHWVQGYNIHCSHLYICMCMVWYIYIQFQSS